MTSSPTALDRAGAAGTTLKVLGGAGIIRPYTPWALARVLKTIKAWGTGPAGGFHAQALLTPHRVSLIDDTPVVRAVWRAGQRVM